MSAWRKILEYTFPLGGVTKLKMPKDAGFLSVHAPHGQAVMYMLVDPGAPLTDREVTVVRSNTDYSVEQLGAEWFYVGTIVVNHGYDVYHVFIDSGFEEVAEYQTSEQLRPRPTPRSGT